MDEELALCLFRVLQELLHNVAKHSGATQVNAELSGEGERIRLQVSDDGIGFDPESDESWRGLGLFSMRERLSLVGGHLSIQSRPLLGTRIEAVVPISRTENPSAGTVLSAAAEVV
jgi:signal transduction histidine kinase